MGKPVEAWVDEVASVTRPKGIHWCDGSKEEFDGLVSEMRQSGTLRDLNHPNAPNFYLHRSGPNSVARTEPLTFVSPARKQDAGPNNNWMEPAEARQKVGPL